MDQADRDYGERLYDVTWLDYEKSGSGELVDAPLAAECEWGNEGDIEDDFEKLLLARAGIRLMIFNGFHEAGSKEIAERLARKVREFNGSRAPETATPPPSNPVANNMRPPVALKTADLRSLSSDLIRVRKPGCSPCRIVVNRDAN